MSETSIDWHTSKKDAKNQCGRCMYKKILQLENKSEKNNDINTSQFILNSIKLAPKKQTMDLSTSFVHVMNCEPWEVKKMKSYSDQSIGLARYLENMTDKGYFGFFMNGDGLVLCNHGIIDLTSEKIVRYIESKRMIMSNSIMKLWVNQDTGAVTMTRDVKMKGLLNIATQISRLKIANYITLLIDEEVSNYKNTIYQTSIRTGRSLFNMIMSVVRPPTVNPHLMPDIVVSQVIECLKLILLDKLDVRFDSFSDNQKCAIMYRLVTFDVVFGVVLAIVSFSYSYHSQNRTQ